MKRFKTYQEFNENAISSEENSFYLCDKSLSVMFQEIGSFEIGKNEIAKGEMIMVPGAHRDSIEDKGGTVSVFREDGSSRGLARITSRELKSNFREIPKKDFVTISTAGKYGI